MTRWMLLSAAVLGASGCVTVRNVTAMGVSDRGAYVAYWEGDCKPVLGCDRGDGKVKFCKLDPATNALDCQEQMAITPLLARDAE
jgi:hypothetical protein